MRPSNILHIVTDQQRFDTIRAMGNPLIQTPHLDRLCEEGTAFTNAYTPAAECVPARACMITGMYADKTGCGSNADAMPPANHPTMMSLLAEAGYRTHGVGKCHFTADPWALRGFQSRDTSEEIVTTYASCDDYLTFVAERGFTHVMEPHGVRGESYYIPQISQLPADIHHTQWVGDRCLAFLERQRQRTLRKPWYLYAGFIHPHPPFAPPNPWHKLYRAPEMPLPYLPENGPELTCFINRFQNRYKYRDRGFDLNLVRCIRAYYYACISFVDYQVGRLLSALVQAGELDRTLIVFTSDHGELLGDFGCFGKRSFHDACQRIPLITRLPGRFARGARCDAPASLVDLLPTFLSTANAAIPPNADGMDLAALARGVVRREAVHFHYARGDDAIIGAVNARWKYAWSAPDRREFLFETGEYPECRNQASGDAFPDDAISLRTRVLERAARHDFSRPLVTAGGQWKTGPVRRMPENPDDGLLFQDPPHLSPRLPPEYRLIYPRKNFLGY